MRNSLLGALLLLGLLPAPAALAQECMADEDCPEGMDCDVGPSDSAGADCPPGQNCEPAPEPQPGNCEPGEITCEATSDCPLGLTCEEQPEGDVDCAAPPRGTPDAGGCVIPPPEPLRSACTFEQVTCETDSDCTQAGFACLEFEEGGACSSTGASCDGGGQCEPPIVECEEPEIRLNCFPARVDCNDDSACIEGWRCVVLPEDAVNNPPPGWEGASQICLPEGLALLLEGRIELGESKSDDVGAGGAATGAGGDNLGAGEAGDSKSAAGDDGGCAVAGSLGGALPTVVWLLLAGPVLARRRLR